MIAKTPELPMEVEPAENYLNVEHSIRSVAPHDRSQTHRSALHGVDYTFLFHRRRGGGFDAHRTSHAARRSGHRPKPITSYSPFTAS